MASLQPVRGTHDLLPEDQRRMRAVSDGARQVAELYGYQEIATPIFEFTEVFQRTLGDTSDIVTKEMYTFETAGGERITLRPENTAGVARAYISNGLQQNLPLKYFYSGPMFRHERPQKGRQRQFHQIGVELLGVPGPEGDVEIIALGQQILEGLGVAEDTVLEINTLGDPDSRQAYRAALVEYFSAHKDSLSEDSLDRLERNPLRILDSKDEGDRKIVENAPSFGEYLNEESRDFFAAVKQGLGDLGIAFTENHRLVRGLDYYTHTAFEFVTDRLGSQSAVMAGGRYDGLIETMGGPVTPGVGWAAGIERLAMLLTQAPEPPRPVVIVPLGETAEREARKLTHGLRQAGVATEQGFSGNLKKRLNRANKMNARFAVILGEDELTKGVAALRDLDSGEQSEVALDALIQHLTQHS